ncbi:zinc ABC transporter substrate-binding protein [Halopseudomonas pachastrellae]|nr:zinc ABC transporter substrate-binding protein [Halopseudomonas pachastrellae]
MGCYHITVLIPEVCPHVDPFPAALAAGLLLSSSALADSRVLTSIKPIQQINAALLDGIDEPAVLLPPGASPHAFALRPSDRRALSSAERIYWVGPNLERFLDSLLHDNLQARELMDVPGLTLREFDEEHAEHGHDDHHHDAGNLDPHIWLSPANALTIAQWMKADLEALYPDQQAQLAANLQRFEARITAPSKKRCRPVRTAQRQALFRFSRRLRLPGRVSGHRTPRRVQPGP